MPARSSASIAATRRRRARAPPCTCGSCDRSVLRSTRPMSGIGDQEAVAVDDVGLALVADLDPRHDVPDELEVDVGDRHRAGIAARAHRDRHVGLGLLAEVHRAEPGLARAARCETPAPASGPCPTPTTSMPRRDTAICSRPVGVELRDVGHLGRLAQQLQELDAAQLDVARIELRQRGVGELLLDLAHVLLDARRRARPPSRAAGSASADLFSWYEK